MTTQRLSLPTGTVKFEVAGAGPIVVLMHGFGPRAWGWPLDRLASDCTVVAMELFEPGAGSTRYPSPIEQVQAVLHHLGGRRFTLCPWSMAGTAVLQYAASQPPELEKLVLVDVAGLGGPLMDGRRPPSLEGDPQRERSPEEWAKIRAESWVRKPGPVRDLVEALDREGLTRSRRAFDRTMDANRRILHTPPPIELEEIVAPTLVLAGRHSMVMGPDAAERVAARLPSARVVVFEESAHALPLEEPEKFQDVVAGFVLEQGGSSPA